MDIVRYEEENDDDAGMGIEFFLLDVYTFRCEMQIIGEVKSDVVIMFTPDCIYIEEVSNDSVKSVFFYISARDLLEYTYNVRDSRGELVQKYLLPIDVNKLYTSIKTDGKKEGLGFRVPINPETLSSPGLLIIREKTYDSVDPVPALPNIPQRKFAKNYYNDVYSCRNPNSKMSVDEFTTMLKTYNVKKVSVEFVREKTGTIAVQSGELQGGLRPASRLPSASSNVMETIGRVNTEGRAITSERQSFQVVIRDTYSISVYSKTVALMMRISKLGTKNIVSIYMEAGCPLVLETKVGNYGVCVLSFAGDK